MNYKTKILKAVAIGIIYGIASGLSSRIWRF